MSSKLKEIHQKYLDLINSIPFIEEDLNYSVLDKHRPHLDELDRIGKSAVSVFDMFRKTHIYISPSYKSRLGLPEDAHEGPEGFERLMHPDDYPILVEAGYHFMKMALAMDNGTLYDYKLVNDFRIRRADQTWVRMTEQHRILETDIHGNIWLGLSIVDVSADQNTREPAQSRLLHQETGELLIFPDNSTEICSRLSARELEILKLISTGRISKQIADELGISIHTVNTHRQNIIEKLNVGNTTEAVLVASRFGLIR